MVIIVTGTPGTGKTTYAKQLARDKGYAYIDLNEFAVRENLIVDTDKKRKALIVDEEKLAQKIADGFDKDSPVVIDGHFSHEIPPEVVEQCIVTKCKLPELRKRLAARKYAEEKIQENLQAEIFDTCYNEALEKGHKPHIVWTDA